MGRLLRAALVIMFALTAADCCAFRYQLQDLGTLSGDTYTEAFGLNQNGDAVGISYAASGWDHAVVWRNGSLQPIRLSVGGEA